jgi:hypothetical protein
MDMLSYFLGRLAGGGTGGSGGDNGLVYTDLVYNDDGSITLTDDEGQEHIMECEYVDGRLEKVKIDGDILDAIYEENTDKLIKLGDINIEVGDYPSEIGNIETLIDNSGVLEDTEGSVSEKVEELIDKAEDNNLFRLAFENNKNGNGAPLFLDFKGSKIPYFSTLQLPTTHSLFKNAVNITSIDFYIDCANSKNGVGMFYNTKSLKYIKGVNCSKMTTIRQMFVESVIEIIEMPLDIALVTDTTQAFGAQLKEIRFVKECIKVSLNFQYSSLLSAESIQSIIDGLATVETAQTLTLHKNIVLTDEQKATINSKGWTLVQ